jgi:hypothetical protein
MADIPWSDIKAAAEQLGVEPCALQAVCEVESNGNGFLQDGRPKILFEPHIFWRELKKRGYNPAGLLTRADVRNIHGDISDILYEKWGARPYGSEAAQWGRLTRARAIDEEAALKSASWGAFQIMGFNYAACGFKSVRGFVEVMTIGGYAGQLEALGGFLTANNLVRHLAAKNWAAFAKGYNGAGYAQNQYDTKLAQAYQKCTRNK